MNIIQFYKKLLRDKKRRREWLRLSLFLTLILPAYMLVVTFFKAYFNPDGSGTVLVGVNWIGEGNIEFVLLACLTPLWIVLFLDAMIKGFAKLRSGIE